ncbi:MAG: sulfite exporter TauE/SafE family protein [Candidatus Omnitrophica bacterium]|nr:sulfite exporter TauE/SafE family protein [Candidatus Omnitrophota bacterium]
MSIVLSIIGIFAAGFLGGMFGVGGGTVIVPVCLYFFKMNVHKAIGTSFALIIPVAFMGSFLNYRAGNVDLKLVLWMAVVVALGTMIGTKISLGINEVVLRRLFAVFLFIIATKMFIG